MKVRFLSGPKTNTIEHLPPHICQPLIAAGICEHIPYRDFRERLANTATAQTAGTCQNVNVGSLWGIDTSLTMFRCVVIVHKFGSTVEYLDGPTKDTPPSIVKQFNDAVGTIQTPDQAEWAAELRERERNKQLEQQSKERAAQSAMVNARK